MKGLIILLFLLAIPPTASSSWYYAASFPTTAVLDNFNRSNEGPPPSANWTDISNGLKVVSNTVAGNVSVQDNTSYWNVTTYGPDFEIYASIPTMNSYIQLIHVNLGTWNGFSLYVDGTSVELYRLDASVPTKLGSTISVTTSSGDSYGLSRSGNTFTIWRKPSGGSWGSIGTRTDSNHTSAANFVVNLRGTTVRVDDFGGGDL